MTLTYNESYDAGDISAVVIDNLVGVGVAIFSFVSLVGLVLLYRWLTGSM